jgi:hypothetical protein
VTRAISLEASTNYIVAVDGSENSCSALEVCLQELMKSRDSICALHVFDSTKKSDHLASVHRPEALKESMGVKLMTRTNKDRFTLNWVDKKGETTKNYVLKVVNDLADRRDTLPANVRPSYFVTGLHGRKETGKPGSMPLLAAGQFHLPNIIIKKEAPIVDRGRIFVASIKDLSHTAPYYVALDLMKPGKGDKLVVLHVYAYNSMENATEADGMLKKYEKYFLEHFVEDGLEHNATFRSIPQPGGASTRDILLEAIATEKADYVILNPTLSLNPAMAASALLTTVIEQADCNVIICKR